MAGSQRVGGPYKLQAGGVSLAGVGDATYNLGHFKTETVLGPNGGNGYKDISQVSFIEVDVTDRDNLDVKALVLMRNVTATLTVANGKTILLHNARYAGEGTISTGEGNLGCRFESDRPGEEIAA